MYSFAALHSSGIFIIPYSFLKHGKMLALCAQQSYPHLFSNSSTDPLFQKPIKQYLYGAAQAEYLGILCNYLGQVTNQDSSITTVRVLEKDDLPVGYVKFTAPYMKESEKIGKIDQLAVLNAFRGQNLGKILVTHALDSFHATEGIKYAVVLTTTEQVGEKFYKKEFDFDLIRTSTSTVITDQKLYVWGRKIK